MGKKPQFSSTGVKHATINGHRFHLRTRDPIPENFLWIDGRTMLVLDETAADFVSHVIGGMWKFQQGESDETDKVLTYVVDKMYGKYRRNPFLFWKRNQVTRKRIRTDLDRIYGTLMSAAEGKCPVDLGLEIKEVNQTKWIAPARMDLAVTYRCNLNCSHCYMGGPKEMRELPLDDWIKIYRILWSIGVPQVVFTGGEPTIREDIVQLVAEAEEFVTGLVTNGTRLTELAEPLKDASLDYVQVTLESASPEVHDGMVGQKGAWSLTLAGIKKALELKMQVVTNTTLTKQNVSGFPQLLRFGRQLGLDNMSCNTLICSGKGIEARAEKGLSTEELKGVLKEACGLAEELGVNLQWYSPTCYNHLNPIQLGLGAKSCSAASYNMLIQPDGSVLPCQSWPEGVGNILQDAWEDIWSHPTCAKLREHGFAKEREECVVCLYNDVCGGGCPLEHKYSTIEDSR